jgi:hypothetical protein
VQAIASRDQAQESRSSIDASSIGTRATVTTDRAELALNHRFNRLSLRLRGSVSDIAFSDTETLGVVTSNNDRGYTQYEETIRATWEFKPSFGLFGEVAFNQRDYDVAAASDGLFRSSNGERYRVGLQFGNTGQILRGEIALGYGVQRPDAAELATIDGLIIDANATYRWSELTSILLSARSDVTETTTANVGGALSRSAGVEVRHAFRPHVVGSAGLTYATQDSQDGVIDDKQWQALLGLEYFVNRDIILFGRYTHTDFESMGGSSDFVADEMRLGVRLRR